MAHAGDLALEGFAYLQKAVQRYYADDPTGAGITCAWLGDKQVWYMSVCRYDGAGATDKEIVVSSFNTDWTKALYQLIELWLSQTAELQTPRQRLAQWCKTETWLGR